MIEDFEPDRIAFAGDWHCNVKWARRMMAMLAAQDTQAVVHLGDFGYWPEREGGGYFLDAMSSQAEDYDMPIFFVDGNHEDHWSLLQRPVDPKTGLREIRPGVYHLPRGHRWEWGGVKFMGLGGAASVDKVVRTPLVDWFQEEELTYAQVQAACEGEQADIMLTHDTFSFTDEYRVPNIPPDDYWPEEAMVRSHAHQALIAQVVDAVEPALLFHGHFHSNYSALAKRPYGHVAVTGLNCDGTSPTENLMTGNLSSLAKLVKDIRRIDRG